MTTAEVYAVRVRTADSDRYHEVSAMSAEDAIRQLPRDGPALFVFLGPLDPPPPARRGRDLVTAARPRR